MPASPLHGRLIWYELLTTDPTAAKAFYGAVVGWTFEPFAGAPMPYDAINRPDGGSMGGVMAIPEGMQFPPHWEMYIAVDDYDAAVAQIEQRGGRSLSHELDIPHVGRLRTMSDPQGAVFAIIQPATPDSEPDKERVHGDASWHELSTTDAAAAMDFYTGLFGWKRDQAFEMGEMGTYHMFSRAYQLGGMMNKPANMAQVPNNWGLYFRVPSVHEGAERVKANGGQVLNGPMEVPGGDWIVNCLDPQGAGFSLHHK